MGRATPGYAALLERELELEREKLKTQGKLTAKPVIQIRDWRGRKCSECGTTETEMKKDGYEVWNHDEVGSLLWTNCYAKKLYHADPKTAIEKHRCWVKTEAGKAYVKATSRRFIYGGRGGKKILLKSCPRVGKCNLCQKSIGDLYVNAAGETVKVRKTHIYRGNKELHQDDPLYGTQELCESCHCWAEWKDGLLHSSKGMTANAANIVPPWLRTKKSPKQDSTMKKKASNYYAIEGAW